MSGTPFTPAEKAEAIRLYQVDKWGVNAIGERLHKTGVGVWRMLKREGVKIRDHNESLKLRTWVFPAWDEARRAKHRAKRYAAQAELESASFYQPSIISFPESPRLEMEWRHVLAEVRAERGAQWTELLGVTR